MRVIYNRLILALHRLFDAIVPEGWEDYDGFHYGKHPDDQRILDARARED